MPLALPALTMNATPLAVPVPLGGFRLIWATTCAEFVEVVAADVPPEAAVEVPVVPVEALLADGCRRGRLARAPAADDDEQHDDHHDHRDRADEQEDRATAARGRPVGRSRDPAAVSPGRAFCGPLTSRRRLGRLLRHVGGRRGARPGFAVRDLGKRLARDGSQLGGEHAGPRALVRRLGEPLARLLGDTIGQLPEQVVGDQRAALGRKPGVRSDPIEGRQRPCAYRRAVDREQPRDVVIAAAAPQHEIDDRALVGRERVERRHRNQLA